MVLFSYCQSEGTEIDQIIETKQKEEVDPPTTEPVIPPKIIEEVDPCNIIARSK